MLSILRCSGLVIFASVFVIRASDAHAERPDRQDFASIRAWVESQPRTFENEVLFTVKDAQIVRSERFTTAGAILGDFDGDGDIDRYDYTALQICFSFSGPGIPTPPACYVFDSDEDVDIDMQDIAAFNTAWTGTLGRIVVEAGSLFPALASPDGYYSGEPGQWGANSLRGIARQAGYTQDDLWYRWSVESQPQGSGQVLISNRSLPATPYIVLRPFVPGEYLFKLTVTNLITGESGFDLTALNCVGCVAVDDCDDGLFCNGLERCNTELGICSAGDDPCGGCACDEQFDQCVALERITIAFKNDAGVDEQLVSYLTRPDGGPLSLTEWEKTTLRPQVRLHVRILFSDGSTANLKLVEGRGELFAQGVDPVAFPDLRNRWSAVTAPCEVSVVEVDPTAIEVFVLVSITAYEPFEITQPDGTIVVHWEPREIIPPQFRTLLVDRIDIDGNIVVLRNIGVRDVPGPIPQVRCHSHIEIQMKGVLSVPFFFGSPGFDINDIASQASVGGRFEFVQEVRPPLPEASVFVHGINSLALPVEFILTVQQDAPVRDNQGSFVVDNDGNVVISPERQTVRLPTTVAGSAREIGGYFDCSLWPVTHVGLGQDWLPTDAAIFVGSGPDGFGLPVGELRPVLLAQGNFRCGDTILYHTVPDPTHAGGVRIESILNPVIECPGAQRDLAVFMDVSTGFATTAVHDVDEEIVQFDIVTNAIIWAKDGRAFDAGVWEVNGNLVGPNGAFQVRFGTRDGERRAYFTETGPATICDISVGCGSVCISPTSVLVPQD